jgi:hypothetical protein
MGSLLSHRSKDVTEELKPMPHVTEKPTKGVPGLVGSVRNKVYTANVFLWTQMNLYTVSNGKK